MDKYSSFVIDIKHFLKNEIKLEDDIIEEYIEILLKNQDKLKDITNDYNGYTDIKYISPDIEVIEWDCGYGSIIINDYMLELCYYGIPAINVYIDGEYVGMITKPPKYATYDKEKERQYLLEQIEELKKRLEELDEI